MARCGATETCPDGAYLNGLCKFHNDCKHYCKANGQDFEPHRFGRPSTPAAGKARRPGSDPEKQDHKIEWRFSQDEVLSILLHDADRIDRPGGPRPALRVNMPCYDPDTYAIGADVPARGLLTKQDKQRTLGINWDYHEYIPRSASDRRLCVSCFSSWERTAWPILRPWVTMDHFCEPCAELKPVKRRWLHERVRRLRSGKRSVQEGMLEQIRREWMWADERLPSVQFAVAKRQEEFDSLKETFVCVLCWAERDWRNDWICKPCHTAWLRAGKPCGPALVEFGQRWRTYRLLHPPGGSRLRLSARQRIEQGNNYRPASYTKYGGVVVDALTEQFDLDAACLPWRDGLQSFREEAATS